MILVTGATGKVGSELIKVLQARKATFQALAHSDGSAQKLTEQGITVKRGSLDQPQAIRAALQGIETVFLLSPSAVEQAQIENSVIDLAKQAGTSRVVKLSVYDASYPNPALAGHGAVEAHLKASGLVYTILQPNYFMQNFIVNDAPTISQNSAIFAPTGDAKLSFVDVRDIAEVAAIVLTEPGHDNQTYEITGSAAYSFAEVTALLTRSLGKPIQHIDLPSDAYRDALLKAGLADWYADLLQQLFAYYHDGHAARISPDIQRVTGHTAHTLSAFFDEHKTAFQ